MYNHSNNCFCICNAVNLPTKVLHDNNTSSCCARYTCHERVWLICRLPQRAVKIYLTVAHTHALFRKNTHEYFIHLKTSKIENAVEFTDNKTQIKITYSRSCIFYKTHVYVKTEYKNTKIKSAIEMQYIS